MNELFTTYVAAPDWAMWGTGGALGVTVLTSFTLLFRGYKSKVSLAAYIAVMVVGLAASITFIAWNVSVAGGNSDRAGIAYEARADWVESHGVNLTKNTMSDLEFPSIYEKPTEDEDYGLAQVTTANREVTTVTLAWEDGQFVLYGTDGEPLERITR